ncbi:MAG: Crp/Fnr family transcriptional regulator [Dehalococcoidia bacterium]
MENTAVPLAESRSPNGILAAIAPGEYERMRPLLSPHPLRMRETLQEAGDLPEFVYFPTSGIISLLTVMENGMMIEFATVGHEGTTGVPLFLGMAASSMALISQVPGEALRMTSADFLDQLGRSPGLAVLMKRYSGAMLTLVAQSAACNRAHHVNARCARWLLMTHNQTASDQFPITQEFLAQMLGVSRPSVTLAAAALQDAGLIRYHHGHMTILDRPGLECASCECYAVVEVSFRSLAGWIRDSHQSPEGGVPA